MTATDLIREVQSHGGSIWVEGDHLELQVPDGFPGALIRALRQHKDEVLAFLGRAESCDLPFPIGYGGLPTA